MNGISQSQTRRVLEPRSGRTFVNLWLIVVIVILGSALTFRVVTSRPTANIRPLTGKLENAVATLPESQADSQASPKNELRFPSHVSRFDIATRDELLYAHWIEPFVKSDDVSKWTWIPDFVNTVGKWVSAYVDANRIAAAIHEGMSIDGQQAFSKLDDLVEECSRILDVKKPTVIVRNDPESKAYVVEAGTDTLLVLTSGMLKLFEGSDDELRFVIGHELGRIKCQHPEIRKASRGLITVLASINAAAAPPDASIVVNHILVGRIVTWARESEISADRAGLICCGRPQTAFNALARLLHGLNKDSKILNADNQDIDADKIVNQFQCWENETLLKLITYLKRQQLEVPFVAERLKALKGYSESDEYRGLLNRNDDQRPLLMEIDEIHLDGLAADKDGIYPYVRCSLENQAIFKTLTNKWGRKAAWNEIKASVTGNSGQPLYFEIYDDGYMDDRLVGGFVIYPETIPSPKEIARDFKTKIKWNWKERSSQTRDGTAVVKIKFHERKEMP